MAWQQYACAHCRRAFGFDGPQPCRARCPSCQAVVNIPAARGRWYHARGRQKVGPLALDGLRGLAAVGRLVPSDMVWQEGTAHWVRAGTVPGLFAAPVVVVCPRRRLLPFAAASLIVTALAVTVALVTWRTSGPRAHGTDQNIASAPAEPSPERLPAPKEAEEPALPNEQPRSPTPTSPDPPASKPSAEPPSPVPPRVERVLVYPSNGQTDVPLAFSGGPEVPGALPGQAGYPVSVTFRPGVSVRHVRARLLDNTGRELAVWLSTPEQPAHPHGQRNSVCLIAREPLRPSTRYQVQIRARVGGEDWTLEWVFTTAEHDSQAATLAARALAKVNDYRNRAGLEPVVLDPDLTNGCQAHCAYLARNTNDSSTRGLGAHGEDHALPGYSEEGRRAGKSSVIAWGDVEPLSAIDGWMATLYHRVPILDPHLRRIGFGHARRGSGWVTALDVMRGKEPGPAASVVLYPAPDQAGVPLTFPANEEPDPIPQAKDRRAGFPITASFPTGVTLTRATFTLKDEVGREVPVWFSSPERPANPRYAFHQGSTVCLIAKEPLRPGTRYTVRGTVQVDGQPWSREWRFATVGSADRAQVAAEVLARVNAYRRAAGLPTVTLDPVLSKGCAAHAAYVARNAGHPSLQGTGIFHEDSALPGYTPEGFAAARSGEVLTGAPSPLAQVDRMMATLFRRLDLLSPAMRRIGVGFAEDPAGGWVCVLDLFRGREPGTASRPRPGPELLPRVRARLPGDATPFARSSPSGR